MAHLTRERLEREHNVRVIDLADAGLSGYADKLWTSPSDAHGPLTFLGWPRCFTDRNRPSRFLVYCRP